VSSLPRRLFDHKQQAPNVIFTRRRYGASMHRRPVAAAVALCALGVVGASASAHTGATPAACRTNEVRVHDEVVFGHFATRAEARQAAARAARFGFKGLKIEAEGCGDFEVEIDGADNQAARGSVAKEAARVGLQVTFEQTGEPLQPPQRYVYGVFGSIGTVAAANALMLRLATVNFRYIDLARDGRRWLVVMPQVPVKAALSIAAEVSGAGFRIAFRPNR
jgi:hypothetical protein